MRLVYRFALALVALLPASETFADTDTSFKSGNSLPNYPAPIPPKNIKTDASYKPGNQMAIYPTMSKRMGEQGTVKLFVLVLADGTVGDIKILESSGHKRLDDAATNAVKNWKFNPATENEIPVSQWYTLPYKFTSGKEDSSFRPIPYASEANINLLQQKLAGKNVYLNLGSATFTKGVSENQRCGLTNSLALAKDMNVAQFIKESFKQGFQLIGVLDENSLNIINFNINEISLNTIYPAEWKITLTVFSEKNKGYQVQEIYQIKINDYLDSENACNSAFKSFPLVIQDLITKIISNDNFLKIFD